MSATDRMCLIMGGTFDPIHFGHLSPALEVQQLLGCPLRIIPNGTPTDRPTPVASPEQRLAMLELALSETSEVQIDTREINAGWPTYTINTLAALRQQIPDAPLALIIGDDRAATLHDWHRWRELLALVHLIIIRRDPQMPVHPEVAEVLDAHKTDSPTSLCSQPAGLTVRAPTRTLDISSTRIRSLLSRGESIAGMVPKAVQRYISAHQIYH